MPRINVGEDWFFDPRRTALMEKIGREVDTVALEMWRLGQTYYCRERSLIPTKIFERAARWKEFEECGLAERRGDGVYIAGSAAQFEWYHKGIEQRRLAGKERANTAKRANSGMFLSKKNKTDDFHPAENQRALDNHPAENQRALDNHPAETSEIQPSSSSSSSISKKRIPASPDDSLKRGKKQPPPNGKAQDPPLYEIKTGFCTAWEEKYRRPYFWGGKEWTAAKRFLVYGGSPTSCFEIVKRYLSDGTEFVAEKIYHDFVYLVTNAHRWAPKKERDDANQPGRNREMDPKKGEPWISTYLGTHPRPDSPVAIGTQVDLGIPDGAMDKV
jgi:hypothetical protein